LGVGAGVGTREKRCELWSDNLLNCGAMRVYFVLEDDLADDDGDGGTEVADEAKGSGCGADISRIDLGL